MKHCNRTNILLRVTGCFLLAPCWGCSMELPQGLVADEGTPVKIMAEIQELSQTKADPMTTANSYDRSSFISADKIRVYRLVGGTVAQQEDYAYSGSAWSTTATNPVTLQAGSTYSASYPSDYTGILQDQSAMGGAGFLKSNYLKSKTVTSRDGILHFTGDGAFERQNAKLTLVFKLHGGGAPDGDFTNALLSAPGLISGGSNDENITLYRPDASAYTWCGIVYPKGASTTISLQLTYKGVVYKASLSCGLAAGTHYTYTMTLKDDILVPQGGAVEDWKSDPNGDYSGEFN